MGLNLDTGWLVIFDRRPNLPQLSDRTTTEIAESPDGRTVSVFIYSRSTKAQKLSDSA